MNEVQQEMKKLRVIHGSLIAGVLIFAFVAETVCGRGSGDWTLRHWLVAGLALWVVSGGFHLRRRLLNRSEETLRKDPSNPKAVKQWEAGQIFTWAMAEGIAMWGLVVRMVLGGALWQASLFYGVGLFLLLLWTPRIPVAVDSR